MSSSSPSRARVGRTWTESVSAMHWLPLTRHMFWATHKWDSSVDWRTIKRSKCRGTRGTPKMRNCFAWIFCGERSSGDVHPGHEVVENGGVLEMLACLGVSARMVWCRAAEQSVGRSDLGNSGWMNAKYVCVYIRMSMYAYS